VVAACPPQPQQRFLGDLVRLVVGQAEAAHEPPDLLSVLGVD
jgi:hypothetical protein